MPAVSYTNINPTVFPQQDILFSFQYSSPSTVTLSFITPGDTVDITSPPAQQSNLMR